MYGVYCIEIMGVNGAANGYYNTFMQFPLIITCKSTAPLDGSDIVDQSGAFTAHDSF